MWILTVGIDKYFLTDDEKKFYLEAKVKGAEIVQLRENLYLSTKFQSLVEENGNNPITSDKNFLEYLGLKDKGDSVSVKRKMALEKLLDLKFPYEEYAEEWDEANHTARAIIKA